MAFTFTMKELTELLGSIPIDKEIYVSASVMDWYLLENHTGFAICVVKSHKISMKLLGDQHRVFIPGFPVSVFVSRIFVDHFRCDKVIISLASLSTMSINLLQSKDVCIVSVRCDAFGR